MAWSVGRAAVFFAAAVVAASACVPIWGDADAVPSGTVTATCKLACDTMADCAARLKSPRLLNSQNCQVYCLKHVEASDAGNVPPLRRDFAGWLYRSYPGPGTSSCEAFDNRLGLPTTTPHEWVLKLGAELQPCIEHTKSTCKATQEQAETICVYEQGIFYGVDGLADCVTSDKTCEAAAQCRRDRAREAGWVEEDKPWWGAPP